MKKKLISAITCVAIACTFSLAACNNNPDEGNSHEHDWVRVAKTSYAATCGEAGLNNYICNDCDETKSEVIPATGKHTYGNNHVCDVCGFVDMSGMTKEEAIEEYGFYFEDKDNSNTYTLGDVVWFGSYPQELLADNDVPDALTAEEANHASWESFDYYDEGEISAYAFYKDIEVGGTKYRGVYLENYRSYYAHLEAGEDYSYIDDNGFDLETVYWFKYSPIEWDVLGYKNGRMFLNASACLEGQPFQALGESDGTNMVIKGTETPVNDWEASTLRNFLNNDFYNTAFNAEQQAMIPTVELDNKNSGYGADSSYQKRQNNTDDKVFLISYQDISNGDYGFTSSNRARSYTDYSTIQGLRPSTEATTADGDPACYYILRSAGNNSYLVSGVSKQGSLSFTGNNVQLGGTDSYDGYAINGDLGVLPALYLKVGPVEWEEHTWEYELEDGTSATLDYAVTFPKSYSANGEPLPLITYMPDSSYQGKSIDTVEQAAMPAGWVTEEMLEKYPAVYLVLTFTRNSSTDKGSYIDALNNERSEESQVINIIDSLVENYNINENKLYLTGQSMGGIFDWAINTVYPEKFAATVYVSCQPGGDVSTEENPVEMYDYIIEQAEFVNQKFVYIASRKDPKAPYGQDDVMAVLEEHGKTYGNDYTLDPTKPEESSETLRELFKDGNTQYFLGFPQVSDGANANSEHMGAFPLCYQIEAILEWLLQQ